MKSILLVGAGYEHILAINAAKALGYKTIVCDGNSKAPNLASGDVQEVFDISDPDLLIECAKRNNVDGIFCHAIEIPDVIARATTALGLPGLDITAADTATNKIKRIQKLKKSKIPTAKFSFADSEETLLTTASKLKFPIVMKPTDTAGSRGVKIVNNTDELVTAYHEAIEFSNTPQVLMEEKLTGPQVSTESIVYNGKVYTFAFADRNYEEDDLFYPYFVENGINYPTSLSPTIQTKILDLVEKTILALGIDFGAAKGDIIVVDGEPRIIEMASRTSGGWFGAGSIPKATGADMLTPLLKMAVGDEPDMDVILPKYYKCCAQRYFIPRESGTIKSVTGIDKARAQEGVEMFTDFFPPVGTAFNKAQNNSERFAQVICTADTLDKAIERCNNALSKIKLEVE